MDAVATPVKERPILFSGPMVQALLAGRKTQTRRVVTRTIEERDGVHYMEGQTIEGNPAVLGQCPYGKPGERLWVRETFRQGDGSMSVHYAADPDEVSGGPWRPSIFMPRWASRIQLEVTEVRVQRLQEISEEDAIAEGMRPQEGDDGGPGAGFKWRGVGYEGARPGYFHFPGDGRCTCTVGGPSPAQCAYSDLWESINSKRAPWSSNPWVWCLTFKRVA